MTSPTGPGTRRADRNAVVPTGVARAFGPEEVIVSKTDPRGVITYANDVFLRVSGYAEDQALGRPHNLIRHPDMPRAVFQLMWDTIGSGREIFAYVLNLAADGGHYWVFAHVTPTFDQRGAIAGYHSNRRWVPSGTVARVTEVYRRLLAVEATQERTKDAIAAGVAALHAHLDDAGQDYDEFVWSLAVADEELAR